MCKEDFAQKSWHILGGSVIICVIMNKVVITGGGGFLGGAIVRQCLARGWKVRALGRRAQPELSAQGVDFFTADIAKDTEKLASIFAGADVVFHVAAKAGVWGKFKDFYKTNVAGTLNVIEACKRAGVKNLVYTSTPSVVFNENEIAGGDESLPYCASKLSPYALTKAEAERCVCAEPPARLRTVSIRPHLIWGLGDPHLVPRVIAQAAQGRLRIVGDGKNKVDLTHVENAAHAHLLAADALLRGDETVLGKAYFVSDGAPVVLWDWINALLETLGLLPLTDKISFKFAYAAGTFLEWFWKIFGVADEPPMTRFVALELTKNHWFCIDAARRELGYAPVVSPEAGFAELVQFYKNK